MFGALFFSFLTLANAHIAAWHSAMYCLDGVDGHINLNNNAPVKPLYQLSKRDWWFQHITKCDEFPPAPGVFLDLPAGGKFQVELATNRAKTSLSYGARDVSDWPDGNKYPENYNIPTCIISPNMHTQNQSMAAGTAFAISYQSDITKVTTENLVVFSVRYHTPWKRVATYDVPSAMPACPKDGCICAWGWIPNGCGEPNMYHQAFRCQVTNARSTTPVAAGKPPVWCEGQPDKCTKSAKQMVYWHQKDGNNIFVDGVDFAGNQKSPGYNMKTGFADGAQNDIFVGPPSNSPNNGASNNNTPPRGGETVPPTNGTSSNTSNAAPPPSQTPHSTVPNTTTPSAHPTTPNPTTPAAQSTAHRCTTRALHATTSAPQHTPPNNSNYPTAWGPNKNTWFPWSSWGTHRRELRKNRLSPGSW